MRVAAAVRATALREAGEAVRRTAYIPEDGRADVARIMVERGLTVAAAYDAWVAAGELAPDRGARTGRSGRSG